MKRLAWLALLTHGAAYAEGARIGLEYEHEKDRNTGISNEALTLKPGWEFPKGSRINLVELLIDANRDASADASGFRSRETKLFLRLRHSGGLGPTFGYYLRGGVGRAFNNQADFNYGYVEPGLKLALNERWEWTAAVREIDAIDGTNGQHVRKLITGPSFALDNKNEFELRYARGTADKDLKAWSLGYVRRF